MRDARWLRRTFASLLVTLACGGSGTDVPPAPLVIASIRITAPRAVIEPGESIQLGAQALTASGAVIPNVAFTWSTSDSALVSLSANGLVTGLSKGDAVIVATAMGSASAATTTVTGSTQLGVRQVVRRLDVTAPDTIAVGDTSQLRVIAYDATDKVITDATVSWSASDSQSVSFKGESVVGEDYGTVTLRAVVTGPASAIAGLSAAPSVTKRLAVRLVFSQIAGGAFHSCGVARNGIVHCWGQGTWGRLGTGINYPPWKSFVAPATALSNVRFTSVAADFQQDSRSGHTCAVSTDASAYCWGSGAWGMLGDGKHGEDMNNLYANAFPTRVAAVPAVKQVALGAKHTCLLDVGGSAWCAGGNYDGEVGVPRTGNDCENAACVLSFTRVSTSQTFQSMVAGGYFNCGLTAAGQAWCWGMDILNLSTMPVSPEIPTLVPTPVAFRTLAAGALHACGLAFDGTAYCWGYNWFGEAGIGPTNSYPYWPASPTRVATLAHFTSIAAGEDHTCALTVDGQAYCWGENLHGQLGSQTTELCGDRTAGPNATISPCSSTPRPVNTALRFVSLSLGWWHTCGLTSAGEVYCWGSNDQGQLGNGDTTDQLSPVKVVTLR